MFVVINKLSLLKDVRNMVKVSKNGKGKTLYIELSIYPCGEADPSKNLTISCPDPDTRFKTSLSDNGLQKFKDYILEFYQSQVIQRNKSGNC